MNRIKELRQIYGLSNAAIAVLLSVTQGLQGMQQTGKQKLPTAVLLKLTRQKKCKAIA